MYKCVTHTDQLANFKLIYDNLSKLKLAKNLEKEHQEYVKENRPVAKGTVEKEEEEEEEEDEAEAEEEKYIPEFEEEEEVEEKTETIPSPDPTNFEPPKKQRKVFIYLFNI